MSVFKAGFLAILVGLLSGGCSAFFLWALDAVTTFREGHPWIVLFLPIAGFVIGWLYHQYGRGLESGNNLIIDEIFTPKNAIRFRLAPLVLFGTLITHLFGGSAGREGTAVQMGGAVADSILQWQERLRLKSFLDRRSILICGVAAGFASVFGTPLAGAIFAFEILAYRRFRLRDLIPCLIAAFVGHMATMALGIHHTDYKSLLTAAPSPTFDTFRLGLAAVLGLAFGLVARLFSETTHAAARGFSRIRYSSLRPAVGGALIAMLVVGFGLERYQGLGLRAIVAAFTGHVDSTDFILKLGLTALTLGSGFKGGEVTPLFFIGATMGKTLATWVPLSPSLLTSMGFIAVFAGAANAPIASVIMGCELFGWEALPYFLVACFASYAVSGRYGIYRAQRPEHLCFKLF